jgi:hypothetical protein
MPLLKSGGALTGITKIGIRFYVVYCLSTGMFIAALLAETITSLLVDFARPDKQFTDCRPSVICAAQENFKAGIGGMQKRQKKA